MVGTSNYNKMPKGFFKDSFIADIHPNIDHKQCCGRLKTSTKHMVVALMDPMFSLLDNNNTRSAVIGSLGHRV